MIYPPVEVEVKFAESIGPAGLILADFFTSQRAAEKYLLGASRFVPYKRLDLVISAGEAAGLPVVIAGSGPAEA